MRIRGSTYAFPGWILLLLWVCNIVDVVSGIKLLILAGIVAVIDVMSFWGGAQEHNRKTERKAKCLI